MGDDTINLNDEIDKAFDALTERSNERLVQAIAETIFDKAEANDPYVQTIVLFGVLKRRGMSFDDVANQLARDVLVGGIETSITQLQQLRATIQKSAEGDDDASETTH